MNIPPPLATVVCAPGQAPHYVELVLVDSVAEVTAISDEWVGSESDPDDPIYGCFCRDDPASSAPRFGVLILAREKLTPQLVVHEITHVALSWVSEVSMLATEHMDPDEQQTYFEEAVPTVAEHLTSQIFPLLWTVTLAI